MEWFTDEVADHEAKSTENRGTPQNRCNMREAGRGFGLELRSHLARNLSYDHFSVGNARTIVRTARCAFAGLDRLGRLLWGFVALKL